MHWPGTRGAVSPPPPGSSVGATLEPVSPRRSRGPLVGAAAAVAAFAVEGAFGPPIAIGPLGGLPAVLAGASVESADVGEGVVDVAVAAVAGAPGTWTTTGAGGVAGRRNKAMAAVTPNAAAAAIIAMAIHGGLLRAGAATAGDTEVVEVRPAGIAGPRAPAPA